jgi:ATP-dependent DNA helicase RecG
MNNKELDFLIQEGEGFNLEFKESYNSNLAREICAMANANGGKVLIGVTDDGKIKPTTLNNRMKSEIQDLVRKFDPSFSVGISEFEGVVIIDVPEGKKKPYSTGGKFYMRQGANSQQLSRDEIRDLFMDEGLIRFDEKISKKFDLENDFNDEAYGNFLKKIGIETRLTRNEVLHNLELLDEENKIKNAGVLMFCRKASKFISSATITCALFRGKTKTKVIDSKEFDADLYTNYNEAFRYLESKINTEYIIRGGGPRKEVLELPEEALREALLNAIAHRDYFSIGNIQISIFSDRIEIDNPGSLIGNTKVEDLYKKSFPRNNLLFGLMHRMELVEKIGSGLMRMNEMMEEYLLPHPLLDVSDVRFSITFERPDLQKMSVEQRMEKYQQGWTSGIPPKSVEKSVEKGVEKSVEKIMNLMRENPEITQEGLSEKTGLSRRGVEKNIKILKEKGLIKRIGPDKGGFWEVVN